MHLADGRELFFFDHDDTAVTADRSDVKDGRDLEPASTTSEIRYDEVLDEWVTIASHRQSRTHLPPADECPLCPSRGGRLTEVPAEDYDVVAFENRFPSFAQGAGRCEVVRAATRRSLSTSWLRGHRVAGRRTSPASSGPPVRQDMQ